MVGYLWLREDGYIGSVLIYTFTILFSPLNQNVDQLSATYDNIIGDVLLSAGIVAYLGAFILDFRQVSHHGQYLLNFVVLIIVFSVYNELTEHCIEYILEACNTN